MDPIEYTIMYQEEDSHWWYRGMEHITRTILERWYPGETQLRILDVGCGTGAAAVYYLKDYGEVTGLDIAEEAIAFCQLRNFHRLVRASAVTIPFQGDYFDLVTSFDVLGTQSITDDLAVLKECQRVLVHGGRVLMRLPALEWLRGQHDRLVHNTRRYTRQELEERLKDSGFKVTQVSYANMIFLPVIWLKRLSERFFSYGNASSDLTMKAGPFNKILRTILASEAPFVARGRLPLGVSVFGIGQKI
jgi:SAM-dependent methyltransferase